MKLKVFSKKDSTQRNGNTATKKHWQPKKREISLKATLFPRFNIIQTKAEQKQNIQNFYSSWETDNVAGHSHKIKHDKG